jgi:hypothetical protein
MEVLSCALQRRRALDAPSRSLFAITAHHLAPRRLVVTCVAILLGR